MKNDRLREMLSYCRPAGSSMESQFINRFIKPLGCLEDGAGNWTLEIEQEEDTPKVLWCCHLDTVHRASQRQKVKYRGGKYRATSKHSNCLGADDTAGVWLLTEMIESEVPGTYVFHYGEEVGCIGASWLAKQREDWLRQYAMSIEFDRRGYTSVVTHQSWGRCASDTFANELADRMGMGMKPDDGGVWTDNVEYTEIIPENVNISVGYFDQHTDRETLDGVFLHDLRDVMVELDISDLPIVRDPDVRDRKSWSRSGYQSIHGDYSYYSAAGGRNNANLEAMLVLIRDNPDIVAELLIEYGFNEEDLLEAIADKGGTIDQMILWEMCESTADWEVENYGRYAG